MLANKLFGEWLHGLSVLCTGLQNDHKAIMADIEVGLHELHAVERTTAAGAAQAHQNGSKGTELPQTFALVDLVSTSSPAEKAVSACCRVEQGGP